LCVFESICDRYQYALGEGCTADYERCEDISADLIVDEAYRLCTCPDGFHWVTATSTCDVNDELDDFEFYHWRDHDNKL